MPILRHLCRDGAHWNQEHPDPEHLNDQRGACENQTNERSRGFTPKRIEDQTESEKHDRRRPNGYGQGANKFQLSDLQLCLSQDRGWQMRHAETPIPSMRQRTSGPQGRTASPVSCSCVVSVSDSLSRGESNRRVWSFEEPRQVADFHVHLLSRFLT